MPDEDLETGVEETGDEEEMALPESDETGALPPVPPGHTSTGDEADAAMPDEDELDDEDEEDDDVAS